jgi:hypothetical protein
MSGAARPSRACTRSMSMASSTAPPPSAPLEQPTENVRTGVPPSVYRSVGPITRKRGACFPSNSAINAARDAGALVGHRSNGLEAYDFALANRHHVLVRCRRSLCDWRLLTRAAMGDSLSVFAQALQYVGLVFPKHVFPDAYWYLARGDSHIDRACVDPDATEEEQITVNHVPEEKRTLPISTLTYYNCERSLVLDALRSVELAAKEYDCEEGLFERTGERGVETTVLGEAGKWRFCFVRQNDEAPWYMEFQYEDITAEESDNYDPNGDELPEEGGGAVADAAAPPPSVPPPTSASKTKHQKQRARAPKQNSSSNSKRRDNEKRKRDVEAPTPVPPAASTVAVPPPPPKAASSLNSSTSSVASADSGLGRLAPKKPRAPAVKQFAVVVERDGAPTMPLSIAICREGGHLFASQDVSAHWGFIAASLRAKGTTEQTLEEYRKQSRCSRPATRIEFVTMLDESGAEVPVMPPTAFVLYAGDSEPVMITGSDLVAYRPHLVAIMRLMGASRELVQEVESELM